MADCDLAVEAGQPRRVHIEAAAAAGWFAELPDGPERWVVDLDTRASQPRSEFHLPDGRWIRHYASMSEKFEWTRYKDEIRSLRRK
jgi:hypothetical protein